MDDTKMNCPFCDAIFKAQEIKVHIAKDHFFGIKPQIEEKPTVSVTEKQSTKCNNETINTKQMPLKKCLENQENFGDGSINMSNLSDTKLKKHGFGKENDVVSVVQDEPGTVFIVVKPTSPANGETIHEIENEVQKENNGSGSPKSWKCENCDRTYSSSTTLNVHKKIQHEGFRYECPNCQRQFKSYNHGHKQCSDGTKVAKPLPLKKCLLVEEGSLDCILEEEIQRCGNEDINEIEAYDIDSDDSGPFHGFELEKDDNEIRRKFHCTVCYKVYLSANSLNVHTKLEHEGYRYECFHCKKLFRGHNAHKKCEDGTVITKPLPLKRCLDFKDKTSQAIVVLKRLSERDIQNFTRTKQSESNSFSCNQCSISFKSKSRLNRHLKSAGNEVKSQCKYCDKTFCTLNSLGRHMTSKHGGHKHNKKIHNGLNSIGKLSAPKAATNVKKLSVSCNECPMSFRTQNHLKRHLKSARKESKSKCKICALTFCTLNSLGRHVTKCHTGKNEGLAIGKVRSKSKKVWKCNECPMTFRTQESLNAHTKFAKKKVKFPCMHCSSMSFCTLNSLGKHMNQAHQDKLCEEVCPLQPETGTGNDSKDLQNEGTFDCPDCSTTFTHLQNLKRHRKSNQARSNCKLCTMTFCTVKSLTKHMISTHNQVEQEKRSFQCKDCLVTFKEAQHLKRHMKAAQNGIQRNCKQCNQDFCTTPQYRVHMANKHPEEYKDLLRRSFQCKSCLFKFKNQHHLNRHTKAAQNGIQRNCKHCNQDFCTTPQYKAHMLNKHGKDRIAKKKRNFNFVRKEDSTKPTNVQRKNECGFCQKTFAIKQRLRRHIREVHEGLSRSNGMKRQVHNQEIVQLQCKDCLVTFKEAQHLKRHMKAAQSGIQRNCKQCNQDFCTSHQYRAHILSKHPEDYKDHLSVKCGSCSMSFFDNRYLTFHTKAASKEDKKSVCQICAKTFCTSYSLGSHMKSVHGKDGKDQKEEGLGTKDAKDQVSMDIKIEIEAIDESELKIKPQKEFQCSECPTSFSSGYHLRIHVRGAKQETKTKCSECPLVYCTLRSLSKHLKSHHPEIDSTCKKCGKKFANSWVLLRHIRVVHEGIKRKSL